MDNEGTSLGYEKNWKSLEVWMDGIRPNPLWRGKKSNRSFCLLQNLGEPKSRGWWNSHVMLSWALIPGETMLVFISWFLSDLWHVKLRFWRAAKDIKWLKWANGLRASRTRHCPKSEPSLPRMKDLTLLIVSCIWDWEPHDYIEVDESWRHNLTTGYYWNIFCQAAMDQAAARERERELVTFSNAYAQNAKFLPLLAKGLGEGNAMLQGARFHQLGFDCWPWPAQQVWIVVPTQKT